MKKRTFLFLLLILTPLTASASDPRVFLRHHQPPEGCQQLAEITVKAGGRVTSIFRSDRYLRKSINRKLQREARRQDANSVHFQDRREFNSAGSTLGLERIEQDALLLDCPAAPH